MSGRSCSRATRVFFKRNAEPAEKAAHHGGVGLDAALGQKPITKRLQSDVWLLRPRGFEKLTMRVQLARLVPAHLRRRPRARALQPFHPFDGGRVADLKTFRSRSAAHAVLSNRVKNSVAQVLRIGFRHRLLASAKANRLNQNPTDSGIPIRFRMTAARSKARAGPDLVSRRGARRRERDAARLLARRGRRRLERRAEVNRTRGLKPIP